jgi:hypothetical protein
MKNFRLLLLSGFFVMGLLGFNTPQTGVLKFDKTSHNFGQVKQNEPVTAEFMFENTSDKPVIIEDATAECGCTKPVFPPRPIAPGKTGIIKVTYDSKSMGAFTKKITVKLINIPNMIELSISGTVIS